MRLRDLTQFLIELSFSNSKLWFDANRDRYTTLRLEFIEFVEALLQGVSRFDQGVKGVNAKDCLFRINRDTRFSNNKNPYKTHFSAAIGAGGRHTKLPMYYVQIGAEESFTAGGVWMPETTQLATIRRFIAVHPKKADALLNNKTLLETFSGLDTDHVLSRLPKGFSEGSELLKYKSFTVSRPFDALEFDTDELLEHVVSSFAAMQPLHKWLREALTYDS
ncbi:MAG: DUF2461 domain-containing protein [Pleurocapsa sp. SU_196_0]|nr:DUF2461 domain-containing protein [Pleurocapsa sp. SU_196_0]